MGSGPDPMDQFPFKAPRKHQAEAIRQIAEHFDRSKFVIFEGPCGCHEKGQLILMADGSRKAVEEIAVGDLVMGWDQHARRVLGVHTGTGPMVRVVPTKGEPFIVNLDHVLTLRRNIQRSRISAHRRDCRDGEVIDVSVREWLQWSRSRKSLYRMLRVGVGSFHTNYHQPLPIDPYFLGVILGDGHLSEAKSAVSKPDPEIKQLCMEQAALWGLKLRQSDDTYFLSRKKPGRNPLTQALRDLGITPIASENRFVPKQYLVANTKSREQLLAGLLDTDGHMSSACYDFISKSKQLADDVVFLSRSLGLAAYMVACEKSCQTGARGTYYRVGISGSTHLVPCRIPRKKAPLRRQIKDPLSVGFRVEPAGTANFYGFTLDGDGRFLLGDFTVTHNSGKTVCAVTLARHYGDAYVCTLTKSLQKQYANEAAFQPLRLRELLGRSNFQCPRCNDTCRVGGILYTGKESCIACPYKAAKRDALAAPITVCNYHSFLYNVTFAQGEDAPPPRSLLVLDEAHELESVLLNHVSVSINPSKLPGTLPKVPTGDDVGPYFEWLRVAKELLHNEVTRCASPQRKATLSELLSKIGFALKHKDTVSWVVERNDFAGVVGGGSAATSPRRAAAASKLSVRDNFSLKPISVAPFGRYFFDFADHVLLMSATILDPSALARSVGIDSEDCDFVQVPSTFPPANRPVIAFNVDMHKEMRSESWPVMIKACTDIMRFHESEKGLLLTPSNEMLKYLEDHLPPDCAKRLIVAFGEKRDEQYKKHLEGDTPSVLAASGMWEGIDLAEDRARFLIMPAMPRPFLSPQVRAKMASQPGWYEWKTMTRCVQGLGRSVRCFDLETEILTTEGWKGVDALRPGDIAYGVVSKAFEGGRRRPFRWGRVCVTPNRVIAVNRPESPEPTIRIRTNCMDAVVTPDHTMIVQLRKVRTTTVSTKRGGKVYYYRQQRTNTTYGMARVAAKDLPARFKIPCGGWISWRRSRSRISNDWFWLMGFIIGDGHLAKNKNLVGIYQSTAPSQKARRNKITATLKRLGLKYIYRECSNPSDCFGYKRNGKSASWTLVGYDSARVRDMFHLGRLRRYSKKRLFRKSRHRGSYGTKWVDGWKRPEKRIPRWVLQKASPTQMLKLLEGMLAADGTVVGNSRRVPNRPVGTYFTSDPILADQLQELLVLCGYRSHISEHKRNAPLVVGRKPQLCVVFSNPSLTDITKSTCVAKGDVVKVWCPSTELGTVIARRRGMTFIAGNSETDRSAAYVLDADFARAVKSGSRLIPQWLSEAVEVR